MSNIASTISDRPPKLFMGKIVEIYQAEGLVDIKCAFPDNRFYGRVSYASVFKDKGLAGFDFVPTRGCTVALLEHTTTDGAGSSAIPLIIGFYATEGKSLGQRTKLAPSDIQVQGKYGNQLLLRSNGDVYLVGDAQSLLAFIRGRELTLLRTTNFRHETAGGTFSWLVDGEEVGGAVAYLTQIKRLSSDVNPYLSVAAGAAAGGGIDITMLTAEGLSLGGDAEYNPLFLNEMPGGCGFKFAVSPAGDVELSAEGDISAEAMGSIVVSSLSMVGVVAPEISISSPGGASAVSSTGEPLTITAPHGIRIETPFIQIVQEENPLVHSDSTEESKQITTVDLLQWLFTHIHGVPPTVPTTATSTTTPLNCPVEGGDVVTTNSTLKNLYDAGITAGVGLGDPSSVASELLVTAVEEYAITDKEEVLTKETKVR